MNKLYGYIQNYNGEFVPTGFTERGAKAVATKRELNINGFNSVMVGYQSPINNMFIATAKRDCHKWCEV